MTCKSNYTEQPDVVTISSLTALTSCRSWQATSVPYQEVCTDPVITSCRQSFCSAYTKTASSDSLEMADHTKMQESLNKSNVLCDVCHGNQKLRAVKSCLQCITSFCETHLENHKTAARLIKHKLINAVDNLEDYVCTKHEKPLELFCRDDRSFLCLICIEIGHKTHNTVPIEQESEDRRVRNTYTQISEDI